MFRRLTTREWVFVWGLIVVGAVYTFFTYRTYTITIVGDTSCVTQTRTMLAHMKQVSPEDYTYIHRSIGIIECGDYSGVFVWEQPPRFTAGPGVRGGSVTWYAGSVVHDACHVQQFKQHRAYTGESAERECLLVQQAALKRLGAPPHEYVSLLEVAQTNYWETPYENRGW